MNINYIGKFTAFVCAAMLASCATKPESISPYPYERAEYIASLPCWNIGRKMGRLEKKLSAYSETQRALVKKDTRFVAFAVIGGMFLFPLGFLGYGVEGDDETADQIAKIKGEMLALKKAFDSRCARK